jgi:hypothetical protein
MVEGHADRLAAVLEREHLLDGHRDSAAVRSAHASITVRARVTDCGAERAGVLGREADDSQRPTLVRVRPRPRCEVVESARRSDGGAGGVTRGAARAGPKEGERFSKTATS